MYRAHCPGLCCVHVELGRLHSWNEEVPNTWKISRSQRFFASIIKASSFPAVSCTPETQHPRPGRMDGYLTSSSPGLDGQAPAVRDLGDCFSAEGNEPADPKNGAPVCESSSATGDPRSSSTRVHCQPPSTTPPGKLLSAKQWYLVSKSTSPTSTSGTSLNLRYSQQLANGARTPPEPGGVPLWSLPCAGLLGILRFLYGLHLLVHYFRVQAAESACTFLLIRTLFLFGLIDMD